MSSIDVPSVRRKGGKEKNFPKGESHRASFRSVNPVTFDVDPKESYADLLKAYDSTF